MIQPTRESIISLREVTVDTVREICRLKPTPFQERFVAPNALSIAQAYFQKEAWFRAIAADDTLVGFVMLEDWTRFPDERAAHLYRDEQYVALWRFLIDGRWQGLGYGRQALQLVIDHVRTHCKVPQMLLSYVPGEGSPEPLYRSFGFEPTGDMDGDEIIMRLPL